MNGKNKKLLPIFVTIFLVIFLNKVWDRSGSIAVLIVGAIMYGKPDRIPPLWLHGIMEMEMEFLHNALQGAEIDKEFIPLLDGTAARDSILTADALTKSLQEDRKVKLSELL